MFGTFEQEKDKVPIVYGLVHQLGVWNPMWVQLHHYVHIWNQFWSHSWKDKLSVLFKGPGWSPGKPRLGCIEDIPEVRAWYDHTPQYDHTPSCYQVSPATTKPYDRAVPTWLTAYCVLHFFLILYGSNELARTYKVNVFLLMRPGDVSSCP